MLLQTLSELADILMLGLDQIDEPEQQVQTVVAEIDELYSKVGPNAFPWRPEAATLAWFASLHMQLARLSGQYVAAHQHALENLRLLDTLGPTWRFGQRWAYIPLAQTCFDLGEYAAARQHILEAAGRDSDNRDFISGTAYTHRWLAYIDLQLGELEQAQQYCQSSLQQALKMPDYNVVASCFGLLAGLAARHGQATRAAQLSGAAQTLYVRQGRNPWEASSLDTLLPGWQAGPEQTALAQAYAAGQTMSVEAAVTLASEMS
jgi:tetratricopeptide (TPR) repeat protein